jgi:hypothetical protein
MAAGVLANIAGTVSAPAGSPATATVYTCPLTANYAVVHISYYLLAAPVGGAGGQDYACQLVFTPRTGDVFIDQCFGNTSSAAPAAVTGSISAIIGPGESLNISAYRAIAGSANGTYKVTVTGYEG